MGSEVTMTKIERISARIAKQTVDYITLYVAEMIVEVTQIVFVPVPKVKDEVAESRKLVLEDLVTYGEAANR